MSDLFDMKESKANTHAALLLIKVGQGPTPRPSYSWLRNALRFRSTSLFISGDSKIFSRKEKT